MTFHTAAPAILDVVMKNYQEMRLAMEQFELITFDEKVVQYNQQQLYPSNTSSHKACAASYESYDELLKIHKDAMTLLDDYKSKMGQIYEKMLLLPQPTTSNLSKQSQQEQKQVSVDSQLDSLPSPLVKPPVVTPVDNERFMVQQKLQQNKNEQYKKQQQQQQQQRNPSEISQQIRIETPVQMQTTVTTGSATAPSFDIAVNNSTNAQQQIQQSNRQQPSSHNLFTTSPPIPPVNNSGSNKPYHPYDAPREEDYVDGSHLRIRNIPL
eukprot:UN01069